jgi:hypothetical protein
VSRHADQLEIDLSAAREELSGREQSHAAELARLEEERDRLSEDTRRRDDRNQELLDRIAQLEADLASVREQRDDAGEIREQLAHREDELRQATARLTEFEGMETALVAERERVARLEKVVDEQDARAKHQLEDLSALFEIDADRHRQQVATLEALVRERDDQLAALRVQPGLAAAAAAAPAEPTLIAPESLVSFTLPEPIGAESGDNADGCQSDAVRPTDDGPRDGLVFEGAPRSEPAETSNEEAVGGGLPAPEPQPTVETAEPFGGEVSLAAQEQESAHTNIAELRAEVEPMPASSHVQEEHICESQNGEPRRG